MSCPPLAAELFKQANQLPSAHIPYSGGPATLTALIAGDIAYSINHIPVVQAINEALALALKDADVRATLEKQGDEVSYSTPKDFATFVNAESTTWTKVVRTADLRLD